MSYRTTQQNDEMSGTMIIVIAIVIALGLWFHWYMLKIVYNWWLLGNMPSYFEFFIVAGYCLISLQQFKPSS